MATKHTETLGDLLRGQLSMPDDHIYHVPLHQAEQDRVVAMQPTGDQAAPGHFFHGSNSERQKTVQIRSRGPRHDFDQAYQDAREIEDALDYEQPADYLAVRLLNGPNYLATDDQGRHEFSYNVLCWIIE